jgi:hypothetical protein
MRLGIMQYLIIDRKAYNVHETILKKVENVRVNLGSMPCHVFMGKRHAV